MRERRWRPRLAHPVLSGVRSGDVVNDVGCGTATQAIELADRRRDITVIGIDGDPDVLALARAKPGANRVDLRHGDAARLPAQDGRAKAVVARCC